MKIHTWWRQEEGWGKVGAEKIKVSCWGGSDISAEDASRQAFAKLDQLRRKLSGETGIFEDYEAEIREEIVQRLDERAIITRNRYGAQVLNVADMMIMDIDKPPSSFWDIFRKRSDAADKEKIIGHIRKLTQKYQSCAFRVYETRNGIRVIVLGRSFNPLAAEATAMMQEFRCDPLYARLCRKQGCFRARLTPKPYRMRLRGHRVKMLRSEAEEREFRQWLADYEERSSNFSTCRLVEQIGAAPLPAAVHVHDEISRVSSGLRLA